MERGQVCDEFIDFHTVGHEPADLQVAHILESFAKLDIHLVKMICLSRDNPSVMQKVFKLLQDASKEAKCPRLVDAPCLLHPTHTSFMVAVKSMDRVLVRLLGHLHGFFKTSTARREDMVEVREELAERLEEDLEEPLDQFFLRHVATRWLEAGPAIKRLLDHWESTVEYFMIYLPNSPLANNKKAVKSKKYKAIVSFLNNDEVTNTKVRAKFLLFLASLTKIFLTELQSEKPCVHKLLPMAAEMFKSLAAIVIIPTKRPTSFKEIKDLDLKDKNIIMDGKDCSFNSCCREELNSMEREERKSMRREMKAAVLAMLSHQQTRFPWLDQLLSDLQFLNPKLRLDPKTGERGVGAAHGLKSFEEEEERLVGAQMNLYQALAEEEVPPFPAKGRIDHWWVKVLRILDEKAGTKQVELERLVMLC